MMRFTFFLITFFLPLKIMATCPELSFIKNSIKEIQGRLKTNSEKPIELNGQKFIVRHGETGKSVDDLLAGNFQGYILDRYKEKAPGECRYGVRDNRTPVAGQFILILQP